MKNIYCIIIFGLISISSYAQEENIEMSQFLFPEFTRGVILMKSGIRNETLLNYTLLKEQMIFEQNGKKLAIAPNELRLIDTVFIENRKFIVFNSVFVELLSHSKWDLYIEHKCKVEDLGTSTGYGGTSETTATRSFAAIYSEGDNHQLKIPDDHKLNPYANYWLKNNKNLNKFTSMRELKKLYKHKADLFKAFLKKDRVKYDDQEGIIRLIEYLESN
ncbi:MAG: hypothetical protein ACJA2S_005672 [Cyclobacteriaceae bacterium]|jgi:hypothetical protein